MKMKSAWIVVASTCGLSFFWGMRFSCLVRFDPQPVPTTPPPDDGVAQELNHKVAAPTNLTGTNLPSGLADLRSALRATISDPPAAAAGSLDAAYYHMLQIRAGAQLSCCGSTGTFHSQWQTNYWNTRLRYLRGEVRTVCEAGLGSGYSAVVFLTATANASCYDDGATFHSFDNGLGAEGKKKVVAYEYMKSIFGGRVRFHFGPQSSEEIRKVKAENPEFVCDVVHIDADHSTEGVMKDIDAMHEVSHESTLLLMDDYNMAGIKDALDQRRDKVAIDTVYSQEGAADWMIQSAEQQQPVRKKKIYIVGRFLH